MGVITSEITSLTIVYSTVYSATDHRKHQSSASLAFVRGIHRSPTQRASKAEMFPFDDVMMLKVGKCKKSADPISATIVFKLDP